VRLNFLKFKKTRLLGGFFYFQGAALINAEYHQYFLVPQLLLVVQHWQIAHQN
jgi:hypothetical protein